MNAAMLLFWPMVAVVLAGGAGAVFARNLVYAALSLGVCLAGLAGLYLFLQAEYVAVIQMIVYVGGILILILFGVMFSRDVLGRATPPSLGARILGGFAATAVLASAGRLAWLVSSLEGTGLSTTRTPTSTWQGQIATDAKFHLGRLLLDGWLVPFLVVAVLLTVVLLAALGLVRKDAT
ncbi:MAG TPA: NADH-quinone oxidoreductase subunit J [Fibrobacteria bacterium]|nr:NADH-quinone oxidoreductase subunit J [Fibrobacteria bacterium]HOX51881.1 NADH-quinone oxidoreductase subunit J [Fibrobacteria bacterium]